MYDKATVFKIRWPIVTHWEFFDHFFNYVPFVIMPVPAEAAPSQAGAGRLSCLIRNSVRSDGLP